MIIGAKQRKNSKEPLVQVTAGAKSAQTRIAFNRALVDKAHLENVGFLTLDHDSAKRRLRFIPSDQTYKNQPAHRILNYGRGEKTSSLMILVRYTSIMFLPLGPYEPRFCRRRDDLGTSFDIFY